MSDNSRTVLAEWDNRKHRVVQVHGHVFHERPASLSGGCDLPDADFRYRRTHLVKPEDVASVDWLEPDEFDLVLAIVLGIDNPAGRMAAATRDD